MGDDRLRPSSQWQSWTKGSKLWTHLTRHTMECRWPLKCCHPLCDEQLDAETSFLYQLDDKHGLRMSPHMKKSWPNRRDSKPLLCWAPDTTGQKRQMSDKEEEGSHPTKRCCRRVQTGMSEVRLRNNSLDRKDSDSTQIASRGMYMKSSSVEIALDHDFMPEVTYSDSISFPEADNSQSMDFFTDESSSRTGLPTLSEPFNDPSLVQTNKDETPSPDDETLFSQFLRSSSSTCTDTKAMSSDVEGSLNFSPACTSPQDVCLLPQEQRPLARPSILIMSIRKMIRGPLRNLASRFDSALQSLHLNQKLCYG